MMSAGVHAARHVELDVADVVEIVEIVEAALDRLGNRNGFGVGKGAEIPTRTAHDTGQQSDIRGGEAKRLQFAPKGE